VDHLSIAWEVPSFKQNYSRNVPDEGSASRADLACMLLLAELCVLHSKARQNFHRKSLTAPLVSAVSQSDRMTPVRESHLAPFPDHPLEVDEDSSCVENFRAASTGGMVDDKEPLVRSYLQHRNL
jgi:hypothetical protein